MSTPTRFRFGTAAEFTASNPTLAPLEVGIETDTGKSKLGNGATAWNALPYTGTTGSPGDGGSVTVVDNLTDGGTTSALSAQQGVVLKAITDALFSALGGKADTASIAELAQDAIANAFAGGTQSGVTITYDDTLGTFSLTVSGLAGTGDVTGPSAAADGELVLFNGVTGKAVKRSSAITGWLQATAGVVSAVTTAALKTALGFTKADIGLANVDNTSDANKPVSTAQGAYADAKVQNNMSPSVSVAPSATAVNTAIATAVTGLWDIKGSTDCSANPNYPAASKGDIYFVSVAGKIGGASGKVVDIGDMYVANADNAGGNEAAVGTSWAAFEHNLTGALLAANNGSDIANTTTFWTNIGGAAKVLATIAAGIDATTKGVIDGTKSILQILGFLAANKADAFVEVLVTSNRAITAADFGKILVNNSATNYALTLPTGLAPAAGAAFGLKRISTGTLTLSAGTGTPTIRNLPGASVPQDVIDFVGWSNAEVYTYSADQPVPTSLNGMTAPDTSGELGYLGSPINSQSAAYTMVMADKGKTIYHPTTDATARVWTIPANSAVAFPIGTVIVFDNDLGAGALSIAITTDTLVWVGAAGGTGTRALAAGGKATAQKVTSTRWRISGTAELT